MDERCVNWGNAATLYMVGYKRAGDVLVEQIAHSGNDADALVYPIVFCYRQYLELLLKDALAEARRCFSIDEPVPAKHSLLLLWRPLRPLIARRWHDDGIELDAVEDALRQFDDVDGLSFAFRHATTKAGERSLPEGMARINLRNLAEVVARVGTFLESCNDALSAEREAAEEYAHYDYR